MPTREIQHRKDSQLFAQLCLALLREGHSVQFRVQGESMRPNILDGDAVLVAPAADRELCPGDIALVQNQDGLRVHRVASCDASTGAVVTRSDTGLDSDPAASRLFGKVIVLRRNSREKSLTPLQTRLVHPLRIMFRRIRSATMLRLRRVALLLSGIVALSFLCATFLAPAVHAQTADLQLTQTASATAVAAGATYTYTEIVKNNTSSATVTTGTITVYMQTPANTTYQSYAGTNWTCTTPTAGNAGPVICTYNTTLASGATASTLTINFEVTAGTASGTTIQSSATVTNSTYVDNIPANNTSITSIVVEPTTSADLGVSMSVSPTPVFVSSSMTYTIKVQNLGQAAASSAATTLTITLPSGLTSISLSAPADWSCAITIPIKCTLPGSLAWGSTDTITITATTPSTPTTLNATAALSLAGDPNHTNDNASAYTVVQPLVCATPGRDGPGGTLTGIVNAYYPPSSTGTLASASTSVALGAAAPLGAQKAIAAGDLLLIIQMQDATINSSQSGSYGDGVPGDPGSGSTSLGSSGFFEFVTATSAVPVTGGTLQFTGTGPTGGLLNSYSYAIATATQGQQTFQVIRVPQYTSATLGSTLAPLAWNGSVGGVLAIDVSSQLTLGGTVAADALGFRGGGGITLTGTTNVVSDTDYVTSSPANLPNLAGGGDAPANSGTNASKGEGIAGTPHWVAPALGSITTTSTALSTNQTVLEGLPNGSFARGAPGNAGGGGTDGDPAKNDYNSGGGAGGNGGTGGQGGYGWNSMAVTNSTDGGFGGVAFPASTSALVMGGGGGAGTTNNGTYYIPSNGTHGADCGLNCTGIYSSGGMGGGIVIVHAGSVAGTGTITSNGQSTLNTYNDSTGGAGAGGSILFFANSGGLGGLTVSAIGGNGGNAWQTQAPGGFPGQRHGPGGGGGGGVIFLSASPASSSVAGGSNGYTDSVEDSYGAIPGQAGLVVTTDVITETPGTQSGAYCASADLSVTNFATPLVVLPGGAISYTQTVTNNGPLDAVSAVFTENTPANTTFSSIIIPAGWTCTTPAVGASGAISCNTTSGIFTAKTSGTFNVVVTVAGTTLSGTQIVDVANITSGTTDPNLANNTAIVITTVGITGTADLAITNTPSSPTVVAGSNVTLTGVITNQGPSSAAGPVFTEAIPGGTTFQSVSAPAGWSCYYPAVGATTGTVECVDNSLLGVNSPATFSVVVNVPGSTTAGTVITATDNVNSATPDPNYSNNSASTIFTVATAGQADLAVTASASPNPVTQGNNITFPGTVTNNGPATETNATFTVAIPANTTFYSLTPVPSGWSCTTPAVGGTGTVTCTLTTSLAVGANVSFPLVVKVNSGVAGGTTISATPSVSSTVGDPNSSNNSATASTIVASPTQSSVTATKTASPEPVNLGSTLTYILTVINSGPAVAQNVTVTDPLPAEVTYIPNSYSTTIGLCSGTTTVTCTLGNLAVGSTAVITINVTATTFSAATLSTNIATVTSSTAALSSNIPSYPFTVSSISTIQASTAVDISSFQAFSQSDGSVILEWRTHEESRNLGFHIYREDASGRTRIDPSLIAGSALLLRGSRPQHAAKIYRWIDPHPVRDAAYWIEELDINGTRGTHGPAYVESPSAEVAATLASARSSALLSSQRASTVSPSAANPSPALAVPRPGLPIAPPGLPPLSVADHQAIKISVDQEGWYHVSFAQLFAEGLDRNTDSRTLHLYAEGVEQPLLLTGRASGPPSPSDAIEFYGTGIDTPFSADRVYWLISGNQWPKRILPAAAPVSGSTAPASFPFTVLREDRTTYFAALLNGENSDNFFGAVITSEATDQDLVVAHIDPSSPLPAFLDLVLQGATDAQEHRVTVQFNGATLGEMDFLGLTLAQQSFPVEPSLLQNGTNTVTLTALNGDNDVSLVQSIVLHYAHTYAADADWLRATASAGSELRLTGFTNPQVRVFDITDPLNISELAAKISRESGTYGAALALSTGGPAVRTILAFANDAISAPVSLAPHVPTFLDDQHAGGDVVIITHPDFVTSLVPLVRLRESQGHHIALVTTDQIFDEYNYGERSPLAIRSFLQEAASRWQRKPQSILFVGDASFDPRDYLGLGDFDFVPTRIIETAAFKTASDDWFTDFAQNGFATIPTGRLPVRTSADADLVVSKIIGYEQGSSAGSWNSQALLIADQNVDSNFTAAANSAAATLPSTLQVSEILADSFDSATVRSKILTALNNGALLVDYNGHGAEQQWSFADLFNTTDASALANGGRLPVYLLMDCLNGFFHDVYAESLAESLLLAPNGGAVAVWASSGFTQQSPQSTLNQAFLHLFAGNPNQSLGRLVLQAKAGTTDNDVRRTWILFGDPAMKLQFAPTAIPARTSTPKFQPVTTPVSARPCLPVSVCSKEKQHQ
ncbi:MAG: C25 family cysteine peptidase [Candidatus Acidiferrum sp.]